MPDMQRLLALAQRGDQRAQRDYWRELLRRGDIGAIMACDIELPTTDIADELLHVLQLRSRAINAGIRKVQDVRAQLHHEAREQPVVTAPHADSQHVRPISITVNAVGIEAQAEVSAQVADELSNGALRNYSVGFGQDHDRAAAFAAAAEHIRPHQIGSNAVVDEWVERLLEEAQQYPPSPGAEDVPDDDRRREAQRAFEEGAERSGFTLRKGPRHA